MYGHWRGKSKQVKLDGGKNAHERIPARHIGRTLRQVTRVQHYLQRGWAMQRRMRTYQIVGDEQVNVSPTNRCSGKD